MFLKMFFLFYFLLYNNAKQKQFSNDFWTRLCIFAAQEVQHLTSHSRKSCERKLGSSLVYFGLSPNMFGCQCLQLN